MINKTSTDLKYTSDGDFMLTEDGELLKSMGIRLLAEKIYRRLTSNDGDWNVDYAVSANLKSALGLEATEANMNYVSFLIRNALTKFALLDGNEIVISSGVMIDTQVFFSAQIKPSQLNVELTLGLIYDSRDNGFTVKFLNEKAF